MKHGEVEKGPRPESTGETLVDLVDHQGLARLVAARQEPYAVAAAPRVTAPPVAAPSPRKSSAPFIALAIVIFALALGGIGSYFLFFSKPASVTKGPGSGYDPRLGPGPQLPVTAIKPDVVEIPGGIFQMGRSDGTIIEGPPHTVTVRPFKMDRTEVTNAEYENFVRETNHRAPSHWVNNKPLAGQEKWPVNNVSYDDAVAFAEWRSKRDDITYRLPTEEEWEYAARNGEQDDLYPWGNSWEEGRAAVEVEAPRPVGSLPEGRNRWGVLDLIGNVWEWTSSPASLYQGNSRTVPPDERQMMIYRGGSYATRMRDTPATATVRNWQTASTTHPTLGFRLVRGAAEP